MSFNNFLDANSALELVKEYGQVAAVIVKHNNPCGVATGDVPGRCLPQGARLRSGLGLRRRHRLQPPGGPRNGKGDHRHLRRGGRGAGVRARCARRAQAEEGPAAARYRPDDHRHARGHGPEEDHGRPHLPGPRPREDRGRQEADGGDEAHAHGRRVRGAGLRLEGVQARQVERHHLCGAATGPSASARAR